MKKLWAMLENLEPHLFTERFTVVQQKDLYAKTFHIFLNLIQHIAFILQAAVIDTGTYYLHPALGGCFGEGCKVAFGYGEQLKHVFERKDWRKILFRFRRRQFQLI